MAIGEVNVTITVQDNRLSQVGFGTLCIIGSHSAFTDRTKLYASIEEVAGDFNTSDELYNAANSAFSQDISPESIKIGRIDAADTDLTDSLNKINLEDPDWYAFSLISRVAADISDAASWAESQKKIFAAATSDSDVKASGTGDIASTLKSAAYNRTFISYLEDGTQYTDIAWLADVLPFNPGAQTWKFRNLTGIPAMSDKDLNSSELSEVQGKNCNAYIERRGKGRTVEGVMSSGRFIDVQRGIDWLETRMEEAIDDVLINVGKVPYTNQGISTIENAIRPILDQALSNTVISPLSDAKNYEITTPDAFTIPKATKLTRVLPDIQFKALVGNAIHGVIVNGTLEI